MQTKDLFSRFKQFDAYPKTLDDFRVKTVTGAGVTIISGLIMFTLFVSELNYYMTTEVSPELFVDTTRHQKLRINIDIVLPKLPCVFLSIDAMDVSGEQQSDIDHNVYKQRLDENGKEIEEVAVKEHLGDKSGDVVKSVKTTLDPNRCESCYGAESAEQPCCNSCEDVRNAYRSRGWAFTDPDSIAQCKREGWKDKFQEQKKEGCRVYGYLEVSKVAGNFHLAPGKSFQQQHVHVHDLQPFGGMQFNMTHHIKHLSFGEPYPGVHNPLDDTLIQAGESSTMYQYFVKVVPTVYKKLNGGDLWTNQYSFTKHQRTVRQMTGEHGLPGVFVLYELSPMLVQYTEKRRSFMHFLTGVCAIVGGVFTVAGLIDSMIYHSARALQKKIDLGKAS